MKQKTSTLFLPPRIRVEVESLNILHPKKVWVNQTSAHVTSIIVVDQSNLTNSAPFWDVEIMFKAISK